MNINKKLDLWQNEKLITKEQKEKIIIFENKVKRPTLIYALMFLGAFCIGLGIVALISANWQYISAYTKLGVNIAILLATVFGIFKANQKGKIFWYEALLLFYALMCMATIGLVAQVYHLIPHGLMSVLFWSALTFPLLWLTNKPLLPLIWLPAFTTSIFDTFDDFKWFRDFVSFMEDNFPRLLLIAGIFIISIAYVAFKKFADKKAAHIITALKFWLIAFIAYFVAFNDFITGVDYFYRYSNICIGISTYIHVGIWILLFGICYSFYKIPTNRYLSLILGCVTSFLFISNFMPPFEIALKLWGAVFTLTILLLGVIIAYKNNQPKLINLLSALMALRFFIVFIQVFGSLLATGYGLIIAGLVFIGITIIWNKVRLRLKGEK